MTWVGHVDFVWAQWTKETVPRKNIEQHITNRSVYSKCPVSVGKYKYTQHHVRENKTKHMTGNNIAAQQGKT
jgi:tellurite resistance-related uncharacterized protein